jgi:hypothetical protein
MVDLANRLALDSWICIPHLADDNYVTETARFFRRNLRTDVKIYVELSNEVWNPLFDQGRWAIEQG